MVRSLASSDSSDSDAASLSSLSRDSSVGSEGAVARRARADQLNAERHRENAKQWFKRQSLDGLLQLARPQLVPARAEGLLRDAQLLQRLCDETIPPNDHTWIYSDQVGNSDSPARHRVEQRTQLLLQQSLAPRLRTKEPTTFIQRAITTAGGNFYRDFIFLVWPLFTDQDRLEFQTWYYNHDGAGVPPDVPEHVPSSSSGIRREQCAAVPRGLLNEPRSVIGRKALNTVKEALLRHPHLTAQYQQAAAQSLQQRKDRTIDACLADAWRQCTKCLGRIRPLPPAQQELSLRAFWFAKRHLRYCQTLVTHYNAPVVWYVSHSLPNRVHTLLPGSVRRLRPLIQLWRAAISFQKQDKILRQKVKERKIAKVDHLISVAQEADKRGLSTLHQLLKHLKPKAPKRSIHFRRADGQLMGIEEEMDKLRAFFSELYQADSHNPTPHFLQEALPVESWEVTAALHSMPAHKALPPGQAPARLWKLAARSVETELLRDFNAALQPGELCFPHHWHDSHLALLAKPHKPPNSPSNLRPINLLVAEFKRACAALPKLLACLQSFGMEVSLEKTVALLAIKGPAAAALLKQYTKRVNGVRVLRLFQGGEELTLPLRREHDYLGVKISYHHYERATVKHRTSLAWVAFNRLHSLLKHQLIPLRKRVLLWQACVWAVLRYGLTAIGLDPHSAQQLRRLSKPCEWCGDSQYTRTTPKLRSMAHSAEQGQAQAEFAQFGAYMKAGLPSSTGAPSTAPSLGDMEATEEQAREMDVDRDRRRTQRDEEDGSTPPQKWAKGDNKGADRPLEPASGKGGQVLKDHVEPSSKTPGSGSNQPPPTSGQQETSRDRGQRTDRDRKQDRDQSTQRPQQQNRGWNQQHGYRSWPTRRGDKEDLKEVIRAMGRLSLRLEDQLSVFSLDVEFILFLQTDASGNKFSITASLYAAAQQWHRQKESDPASLTQPMRNILLYCLFSALLERLEKLETDSDMMAQVRLMGLVEGEAYLFLQWDAAQGKHIKAQVEPLSHREAVESVRMLLRLATFPHVVGRFHTLRKLTATPSGDVIPFTLMAQNRTAESHQLYNLMYRLARNSVWHLIGATRRPTKIGRSPLAKQLDRMIQNL
ncbi:unnamed protein product [Symbiodinium sp. KB8]|nr:unnamed protein product [Symbiodinium sp. KB8]